MPRYRRRRYDGGMRRKCKHCGYDLHGHAWNAQCPECGPDGPVPMISNPAAVAIAFMAGFALGILATIGVIYWMMSVAYGD